jgi:hypothetical protein
MFVLKYGSWSAEGLASVKKAEILKVTSMFVNSGSFLCKLLKAKAVQLHAMKAFGGRGGIAPNSRLHH